MSEITTNSAKAWLLAARPKTLAGAAVPVMIGSALAVSDADWQVRWLPMALCFLFAFVMQIDANFINDYFDFRKGADDEQRLGPKRACAQGWVSARAMQWAIGITTFLACIVGLPLIFFGGWEMLAVGAVCVLFCFLYTTHLSYVGMGDLLVLLFFGIVPVTMTYYLVLPSEMQTVTTECLLLSVACGLVVDTLLVVNNVRDIDNDRRTGKRTLIVAIGRRRGQVFYFLLGFTAVILGCFLSYHEHHWATWLPIIFYQPFHVISSAKMWEIGQGAALNRILGQTARNIFIYGLAVSIGLLLPNP
ncbi:MAG: 1,4-dihydroxy-2-naphthoate octaprenyltransferase [Prevotella sp.]|nr:1,4-dihydroxy-2-naphthoate octaprenyltransferase [Prevotella sp.]